MTTRDTVRSLILATLLAAPGAARAAIPGLSGTTFNLTARADVISTGDGDSMFMWGYAVDPGRMQYPGPTLIVNEGDTVTVNLRNQLPVPVSIVFPGQRVTATGGNQGLLTREVPAAPAGRTAGPVAYTFVASRPGTFAYHSGTRPDLEVEMGLVGAIVVRPRVAGAVRTDRAYADPATAFDREYLFVLTETDPAIHRQVAFGQLAQVNTTRRRATMWFINGRNFPDTMADAFSGVLPTQPYNSAPMMHPGDRVLMRIVGGGADLHPLHTHGQNHLVIARDARLLASPGSPTPDLAVSDYTTTSVPGETFDAIWGPWTGARLGWDIYGTPDVRPHACNGSTDPAAANPFDPATREYCPDHYKPFPVLMPAPSDLGVGAAGAGMWSGTPFLGVTGPIPPVTPSTFPAANPDGGYTFMWHSHSERELTTNDIFPGGMATMAMVVPPWVPIP